MCRTAQDPVRGFPSVQITPLPDSGPGVGITVLACEPLFLDNTYLDCKVRAQREEVGLCRVENRC